MPNNESDDSVLFRHWIKANPQFSCSLEMKTTHTDSIAFKEVKQEQLDWGEAISGPKGALIRVVGTSGEPDYIWCRNMPAYIVIRYPKSFELISVGTFILEKERSKRKSLTFERAKEISTKSIKLK